jgi:hypothetical protein
MEFFHIRMVIGIILGLAITHMLRSAAKFIQHPGRVRPYWVHLLWALYIFLLLTHFWWWEFRLTEVKHWTFQAYLFLIFYIVAFYSLVAMLFPDDIKDFEDYKAYYFSSGKWFFSILALTYLLDIADTLLKGKEYYHHFGVEYPIRNIVHFTLCIGAIWIKKPAYHATICILFILYELSYIFRLFDNFT